jgi:hypothetical protein
MDFSNVSVNIWAVFASVVASIVIGSIWYGPLFGKVFMKAMGMDLWTSEKQALEKKRMPMAYLGQMAASLVMFYVFGWLLGALGAKTVMNDLQVVFWVWLGFVVPVKLGDAIWGGSKTLFWIGISNMFVTLLVTAAIISAWR